MLLKNRNGEKELPNFMFSYIIHYLRFCDITKIKKQNKPANGIKEYLSSKY